MTPSKLRDCGLIVSGVGCRDPYVVPESGVKGGAGWLTRLREGGVFGMLALS